MTVRSQAARKQILPTLARVRSILDELSAEIQRTATEHELLADWHTKRGEAHAARSQRRAAAVQHLRLADLEAAFDALDKVAFAALDLDPANSPPPQLPAPSADRWAVVTAADSFLDDQPEPA
jgi:hypothetical protein